MFIVRACSEPRAGLIPSNSTVRFPRFTTSIDIRPGFYASDYGSKRTLRRCFLVSSIIWLCSLISEWTMSTNSL